MPGFHDELSATAKSLVDGIQTAADKAGIPLTTNQVGGMFGIFFSSEKNITSFSQVMKCDQDRFKKFFHGMLEEGIYLAPSAFEAGFVSSKHSKNEIAETVTAAEKVLATL